MAVTALAGVAAVLLMRHTEPAGKGLEVLL
jgi:hypothetical protein